MGYSPPSPPRRAVEHRRRIEEIERLKEETRQRLDANNNPLPSPQALWLRSGAVGYNDWRKVYSPSELPGPSAWEANMQFDNGEELYNRVIGDGNWLRQSKAVRALYEVCARSISKPKSKPYRPKQPSTWAGPR